MASPDESRVDEACDQSGAPASPDPTTADPAAAPPRLNGGSAADEPSEAVSPGRARPLPRHHRGADLRLVPRRPPILRPTRERLVINPARRGPTDHRVPRRR